MAKKVLSAEEEYYREQIEPGGIMPAIGVLAVAGGAVAALEHGLGVFSLGIILLALHAVRNSICRAIFATRLYQPD